MVITKKNRKRELQILLEKHLEGWNAEGPFSTSLCRPYGLYEDEDFLSSSLETVKKKCCFTYDQLIELLKGPLKSLDLGSRANFLFLKMEKVYVVLIYPKKNRRDNVCGVGVKLFDFVPGVSISEIYRHRAITPKNLKTLQKVY